MSLHVVHPWWLLLTLPVAVLAVVAARRPATPSVVRVLAPLSLLLVVAALAQPELRPAVRPTVLVLDHSASIDARMRGQEDAWLKQARSAGCPAPCRAVVAAGSAVLTPPRSTDPALAPGTNLQAAVQLGLDRVPDGGRLVVLSDGRQTTGDVLATAAAAVRRHVRIDVVPLVSNRRDAAVTRFASPPAVRAGDEVILQATIRSTAAATARVTLSRDGTAAASQRLTLRRGDNPLPLSVRAPQAGWHDYAVQVTLTGDTVPQNDRLSAALHVERRPRVLVASAGGQSALAAGLAGQGLDVGERSAAALPTAAAAYGGVDAVVLDDVDARALGTARQAALTTAVRDDGLGLFVAGGPHSFSLGHYAKSALEPALPVTSRIPGNQQRRNVALELVIDRSGSMLDEAGGFPKIDEARAAARTAARFAGEHRDELGVVAFDATPHLVVPFGRIDSAAAERDAIAGIDSLTANGGTNIPAAVAAGLQEIEQSKTQDRHIILLTDGQSVAGSNYPALAARMKQEHITISVVAVGTSSDANLATLARATGGEYYIVANAAQLPSIFSQEANRAAQPVQVRGSLAVTVGAPSPIVRSLSGTTLPPVLHNVITTARPQAQQTLQIQGKGRRRDPGLVQWQYGLGRVAVWTPGVSAAWAGAWAGKDAVWGDAVRWAQRPVTLPALTPTLDPDVPRQVVVDPAAITGRPLELATLTGSVAITATRARPLVFAQVAPSRYAAPAPALTAGVHGVAITASAGAAPVQGLLAVPYDPEYLPGPADTTPLGALAAQTGGTVHAPDDPRALGGRPVQLWPWAALLALLAFVASAILRLLGRGGGRGRPGGTAGGAATQTPTSPARSARSKRTSSAGTSVGAET